MIKKSGKEFYLCPLEKEDIEEVLLLCDRCVGKNLYQKEELAQTIGSKERWFLLLKTAEGELAGYIYYYITNAGQIAEDSRISIEKIRQACGQTLEHVEKMQSAGKIQPVGKMQSAGKMLPAEKLQPVGKIQSVGVKEAFRGQGLAVHMVQYAMNQFSEKGIREVFIICWNAGGRVPLAKTLQKCRFIHLSSAKKIWYDKEDLFCRIVKGAANVMQKFILRKEIQMKIRLLPKFILSLGVMGVILTIVISLFSYNSSKTSLEDLYAQRVMTNSNSIADMLPVSDVKKIMAEGGDKTEEYSEMVDLFNKLKKDGGVTYLSLVVPDEDSVHFYIDAMVEEMGDDPANQIAYGSDILYTDVANPDDPSDLKKYITIWNQYQQNKGVDRPLVTDNSYGYNYTGISVILDENGQAVAEIQYILDMKDVRNYLNTFLIKMLLISFLIIGLTMAVYIVFVRRTVTKPIGRLADFTQEITESGKFEIQRITMKTGDEIEALSDSFNFMMEELENYIANLSKVTAEKERIGTELDIARNIQASMLPCIFPAFPERKEFDIYATMTPAKEVGGDFYDFFMVDETHLAIVMADVSGKGVPAALFMVIGKTLIKDHTTPGRDLGEVFSMVNNLLCEANSEGLFITAFEGVLDLVTGEFCFVNAGHEMPFICKAGSSFEAYKINPAFVLAGFEDMNYRAGSMTLDVGDKVFQYTDGVTEATNGENQLYGMERLERVLNRVKDRAPSEILHEVKLDIDAFVGEAPQFDDITMLCVEYKAKMDVNGEKAI